MRFTRLTIASIAALSLSIAIGSADGHADDPNSWPQWRGTGQNGVATGSGYPTTWSETKSVQWKTELSGVGGSTPVIAGSIAYLTAGVDGQNTLIAIDLESGDQLWSTSIGEDRGNKHRKGSGSNPSVVIDDERLFAYFRSGDLACVNFDGEIQWQSNLQERFGEDTLWWDLGSSPTLINDLVVVAVMQSGPSYLVAYERKSGELAWKTDRVLGAPEEAAQSYATPIGLADENLIAVMGADHLTIHSASDGREVGRVGGFNPDQDKRFRSIASPAVQGDLIVCPYSRGATVTTCRISDVIAGKGRDSIVWFRDDLGSDVPTPAVHEGRVYFVGDSKTDRGKISSVDLETGKTLWSLELPRSRIGFSSSPLVAGNRLYVTGEDASTYVIGPLDAEQPTVLETNRLGDDAPHTVASPVPFEDSLIQRTRHAIYRLGE